MCLLSYYPPGVMPDTDALSNGAYLNDDGHGFAIITDKRIIVRHSMDAEVLIATFARTRGKHPHGPALFHSRFGTHGTLGRHNCHPFQVGGDRRTVLAHNGILPELVQPTKGDKRCDTRVAAEDFLPGEPFGPLDDSHSRDRLAAWLGARNKVVILTINPAHRQRAYLINAEHGIWDDGIWYSNTDYQELPATTTWLGGADDLCPGCGAADALDPASGYCPDCDTCLDCAQPYHECLCWQPATTRHRGHTGHDADYRTEDWNDEHDEIPAALRHLLLTEGTVQ